MSQKKRRRPRQSSASKLPPAPRIKEIMDRGWCRRDAEHLGLIEFALGLATDLEDDTLRIFADNVSSALMWEPVYYGAQAMYTDEEWGAAWRRLAAVTKDDAVRSMMETLAAIASDREVLTVDRAELTSVVTDEDLDLQEAARLAEAVGDFERAADLLRSSVRPLHDPWLSDLEYVAQHGEAMSPARWGRWICAAAMRWSLNLPAGIDAARHYATVCLTAMGATADMIREQVLPRAFGDQLVHDVLLFDEGALQGFIEGRLDDAVAARVPRLPEWTSASPSVVRFERRDDTGLAVCRNLVGDELVTVGDERLADDHPIGRCFYGRLVPVVGDDVKYFATLPTIIPEHIVDALTTAIATDAPPERRLIALHRGLEQSAA